MDYLHNDYFVVASLVLWCVVAFLFLYMILFGRRKFAEHSLHILSLREVNKAIEETFRDPLNTVNRENLSKITTSVIWRFTRIGVVAIFLGSIPTILLFQQNNLIRAQNSLFEQQSSLLEIQNSLVDVQIRPFITTSNTKDLAKFQISVYNRPAIIDTIVIEYSVKEYGVDGFNLIDRDTMLSEYIYPNSDSSPGLLITNNILTDSFIDSIIARRARLARYTRIVYSPVYDGFEIEGNKSRYENKRLYFFSRKSRSWYSKAVNENIRE